MLKKFMQMRRDRTTFTMSIGIPIMQLILFGYAINTNSKHLPTVIVSSDHSVFTRQFLHAMQHTEYFKFTHLAKSEDEAQRLLSRGDIQFIINIGEQFARKFVRGERPASSF